MITKMCAMTIVMFMASILQGSQVHLELSPYKQLVARKKSLSDTKLKSNILLPAIKTSKPQKATTSPVQRVVKLPLIGNSVLTTMAIIARKRSDSEAEEQNNKQKYEERFSDSYRASPNSKGISLLAKVVTLDDEDEQETPKS